MFDIEQGGRTHAAEHRLLAWGQIAGDDPGDDARVDRRVHPGTGEGQCCREN